MFGFEDILSDAMTDGLKKLKSTNMSAYKDGKATLKGISEATTQLYNIVEDDAIEPDEIKMFLDGIRDEKVKKIMWTVIRKAFK